MKNLILSCLLLFSDFVILEGDYASVDEALDDPLGADGVHALLAGLLQHRGVRRVRALAAHHAQHPAGAAGE